MSTTIIRWLIVLCAALSAWSAQAATERYDYDPLGRLIRYVDAQGRLTDYVYDAAGNILQVNAGGAVTAAAPVIASVTPGAIRRGESRLITVAGAGFTGARVTSPDPELDITGLQETATQLRFTLSAGAAASTGVTVFTVANAAGTASFNLQVNPLLPVMTVAPQPIAVPPNGTARRFNLTLSNADGIDHVVNLAMSAPARATVSPVSVTVLAGSTEVAVFVTGLTGGQTTLALTSATLAAAAVPVFVTAEFTGLTTSIAQPLGVVLTAATSSTSVTTGPVLSRSLGVAFGVYISNVAPRNFAIGSGPATLTISGAGLQGVTSVALSPATGVTVGALTVAPGGTSISVPLTVAADAPATLRRLVIGGAAQPYTATTSDLERILITQPPPLLESIDPYFILPGTTAASFILRGRNLHEAQNIVVTPATGISIGLPPAISADGTTLTTSISADISAAPGNRIVTVTTPGGTTSAVAGAANTLSIINSINAVYSPILAPAVGVVFGSPAATGSAFTSALLSGAVGVSFGPAIASVTPRNGAIGTSFTLTVGGNDLGGVTALQFNPATGISTGALVIAPDGKSLTAALSIDLGAAQTLRKLSVLAGTAAIPFANAADGVFSVTAPQPVIESVTPLVLTRGITQAVTVGGRNFQNATVSVSPSAGIAFDTSTINGPATSLTVNASIAANAATGPRVLVVTTPAGDTGATATVYNTITLVAAPLPSTGPVLAAPVGVVLQEVAGPAVQTSVGPILAPALGVVFEETITPVSTVQSAFAGNVGVLLGPVITGATVPPLAPGGSGSIALNGYALSDVTSIEAVPSADISFTALNASTDGAQVTANISVGAGAALGARRLIVKRSGVEVPVLSPGLARFAIAIPPTFDSITPIIGNRGQTVSLTVIGQNFQSALAVIAEPGIGIRFDGAPVTNAAGTQVTINFFIAPDAPLGSHVIRVAVPGGISSGAAAPANTFTVFP